MIFNTPHKTHISTPITPLITPTQCTDGPSAASLRLALTRGVLLPLGSETAVGMRMGVVPPPPPVPSCRSSPEHRCRQVARRRGRCEIAVGEWRLQCERRRDKVAEVTGGEKAADGDEVAEGKRSGSVDGIRTAKM